MLKTYGSVFAERHGSGPPRILAIHGWGRDRKDFRAILQSFDALAVDLPGFGTSPPPETALGSSGYAAALRGVMEAFEEPPIVVAHSFGGRVAVQLAVTHTLRRMVLTGVPLLRGSRRPVPAARFRLWRRLARWGLIGPDRMENVRRRYGSADYRAARGVMREVLVRVLAESYETQLPEVGCRVELVWGAKDREVPVEIAQRAANLIPDAGLTLIPNVGHLVPLEAPGRIRSFLEE